MHLVFLNQYYPPDAAPTGVMLAGLVQGLIEAGHEVSVLCAAGGYAGRAGRPRPADLSPAGRDANDQAIAPDLQRESGRDEAAKATACPRIIRIGATRFGRGTWIGKLIDYGSFFPGAAWRLLTIRPRPDRIVALTTPPFLSVLARFISKLRGADHAHWVMDLYPDVMVAHGMLGGRSILYRILTRVARWGFGGTRCAAVLTLGPDMAVRAEKYVGGTSRAKRVTWVPLWAEGQATTESALALRSQRGWGDEELIVMYSGNMGLGHRFGEILAAAKELAETVGRGGLPRRDVANGVPSAGDDDVRAGRPRSADLSPQHRDVDDQAISSHPQGESGRGEVATPFPSHAAAVQRPRFVFFGGGKRRVEVARFVRENPGCGVELYDYAPAECLAAHLQSADVHLATLDPAWTGTMVPSKVQGVFGASRPVIFIGSADSSIGRWVLESGGGWVVAPADVAGLLAALAEARDPEVRATRGHAAKAFSNKHFDQATNVARVAEVLGKKA